MLGGNVFVTTLGFSEASGTGAFLPSIPPCNLFPQSPQNVFETGARCPLLPGRFSWTKSGFLPFVGTKNWTQNGGPKRQGSYNLFVPAVLVGQKLDMRLGMRQVDPAYLKKLLTCKVVKVQIQQSNNETTIEKMLFAQ